MTKNYAKIEEFVDIITRKVLFPPKRGLNIYLRYLFDEISFEGKSMLDVGGGSGLFSFFAAYMGAKSVVCLEPEQKGSTKGISDRFEEISRALSLTNVKLERVTFQDYNPKNSTFDIILLHNSINHLDEEACINLLKDSNARNKYRKIFNKLSKLSNHGAKLIITDCSRYNFFATIGVRNPFAKSIEWHKHQAPKCWSSLLQEFGFANPKIRWSLITLLGTSFLGRFVKWITSCSFVSFFLNSYFLLIMEKIR